VGNALKYTETGIITISLGSLESEANNAGLQKIRLTVQDTGIGIAKSFLDRELYTPFKQENSHASGTGLGLSIVRRICKDGGAELNITSELGVGTCATVDFLARLVANPDSSASRGLNVDRFHWFTPAASAQPSLRSIAPSVVGKLSLRQIALNIANMFPFILQVHTARDWLECQTSQGPICEDDSGSTVYAIAEEDLSSLADQRIPKVNRAGKHPSHILILASSMTSVVFETESQDMPFTPVFVHQPIGPRKLLRAITADQSSTEMSSTSPRRGLSNAIAATRPLSMGRPPIPWEDQSLDYVPGAPSVSTNATGSNVNSTVHSSLYNSANTERSNSIDSAAWHGSAGEDVPRDTVLLVEDNEGA
jgi:anti-sigma regulatory factor (Ser/Thr protein kinase)